MAAYRTYRFEPAGLDHVEDLENYGLGGLPPISIGDYFSRGRYKVVHKLGYGGSSTVWLARDNKQGRLVALKALRADESTGDVPELAVSNLLRAILPCGARLNFVVDHFLVQGVNGTHLFLISPLAGPSMSGMSESPGRIAGTRRLRADLARKVARQTATALYHMHAAGVVHGDLTTSNIFFSLAPHVERWSDAEVYAHLGEPYTLSVKTNDGTPRPSCAPARMVQPISNARFTNASHLQESIVIGDFGQSYVFSSPPPGYQPATAINYFSPELRFERRAGLEADIWALGCAIFEMRAGFPLFDSLFMQSENLLVQTITILGRLPDPWWSGWERRTIWFEEDGSPKSKEYQKQRGSFLVSGLTSIREELREIGVGVSPPSTDDGPMLELSETALAEEEVNLLGDLLEKMLRYRPEERIKINEVLAHPWFNYTN